jgi:hypothetical protein
MYAVYALLGDTMAPESATVADCGVRRIQSRTAAVGLPSWVMRGRIQQAGEV